MTFQGQIAISNGYGDIQQINLGVGVDSKTLFEIASLSKTIGTCLALEVLKNYDIDENCLVIPLLKEYGSQFSSMKIILILCV